MNQPPKLSPAGISGRAPVRWSAWVPGLVLTLGACGAPQYDSTLAAFIEGAPLDLPAGELPAINELEYFLDQPDGTWSERLVRSLAAETAGSPHDALAFVTNAPDGTWTDGNRLWALLRAYTLLSENPSLVPLATSWIEALPSPPDPLARLVHLTLRDWVARDQWERSDADELFDPGPFGAPAWWLVTDTISPFEHTRDVLGDPRFASLDDSPDGLETVRRITGAGAAFRGSDESGLALAESWFEAEGELMLWVQSSAGYDVEVDGLVVASRDGWQVAGPQARVAQLTLNPGSHRVRIQLRQPGGYESVALRIFPTADSPPPTWLDTAAAEWAGHERVSGVSAGPAELVMLAAGQTEVAALLLSDVLDVFSSGEACRLTYVGLKDIEHPLAALPALRTLACMSEVPQTMADDLALTRLRALTDLWEEDAGLQRELAIRLHELEQLDEALQRAQRAVDVRPEGIQLRTLAQIQYDAGWYELSEPTWEQAATVDLYDCSAPWATVLFQASRGQLPDPAMMPATWMQCSDVRDAVVEYFTLPAGDLAAAIEHARRRYERDPSEGLAYADLLMGAGRREEAMQALHHGDLYGMRSADWLLADIQAQSIAGSIEALEQTLSGSQLERRLAVGAMRGTDALSELREDGMAVVQDYLAAGVQSVGSVALVHDYMGTRYFEDGSVLSVVHTIQQVLTRDALFSEGEVGIPPGAVLLQARTIKADGTRTLVPELIPGKDSISMPDLEIGDFIEIEYAMEYGAEPGLEPSVLGDRFYFQIPSGPMYRSVMRYQYPAAWSDEVIFDLRAFEGERLDEERGDTLITTFTARDVAPLVMEALAPNPDETTPSVRAGYGRSWPRSAEYYTNYVLGSLGDSRALDSIIDRLRQSSGGETRALVQSMFQFVMAEVEGLSMFFSEPAIWTLMTGEGDRTALLYALLLHAGLQPDLVFVRTLQMDQSDPELVDDTVFDLVAIRVRDGRDDIWLEPDWDNYPFDFLRPEAQGCVGFVGAGPAAGQFLATPVWSDDVNGQSTDVVLRLQPDGSALVSATMTLGLSDSVLFRDALSDMASEAEIMQRMEGYLARAFPGLDLTSMQMPNLDETEQQLTLIYEAIVPAMASMVGSELVLDSRLGDMDLQAAFASSVRRTLPVRLTNRLVQRARFQFIAPEGMRIELEPVRVDETFEGIHVTRQLRRRGSDTAELVRSMALTPFELPADDYGELTDFVADIEAGARVQVRMVPE